MTRTVPGSGAVIEPIFDKNFGVRAITVVNGGSGYDPEDPPRLTVTGCGTPDQEALLYPIIDDDSGRITHVRVLERGRGYDPLRLQITPLQETPNVIDSFDINRIWQTHPNSLTRGTFQQSGTPPVRNDRLRIEADNHPKPTWTQAEAVPGGGPLDDRSFDQVFIYRGGKDVPNPGTRVFQSDKTLGIFANGGLLHTPEWGTDGNTPTNFSIDSVKYDYVKDNNQYDAVVEGNNYYYQSSKIINEFATSNGVFEWGKFEVFTWNIKVEYDNILIQVQNVDETLGQVEVGRFVDQVSGNARGEIAKVVRNSQGVVTRLYLRNITNGPFADDDLCLGSNGFTFTISADPRSLNIYYIDFGPSAAKFGPFSQGVYYFAPENIQVKRNYLIRFNQSDSTNAQGIGHPIQFSTTADGLLNGGELYYGTSETPSAPGADYENEFQPLFIMNSGESNRIYFYCKHHRYMSGYEGDEGYMVLSDEIEDEPHLNNYYLENYYQSDANDPNTIDRSRHVDGHSKVLGMSFDGYPIYGPWGYNSSGTVARETSSYRLRTTNELAGARPEVSTTGTVNYTVTILNGKFLFDGNLVTFLNLERGKTYIFNVDDSSNDGEQLLLSETDDGWHGFDPAIVGNTNALYSDGVSYYIDGSEVTYLQYISGFNASSDRELRIAVQADAPRLLYLFGYSTANQGIRVVQDKYLLGDLTQDYIYDSAVGSLDEFNGKFAVTPEYPNGTYAYFMTENSSGEPVYPYIIGPKYYGVPLFEGDTVPSQVEVFPTEATGDIVIREEEVLDTNGDVLYPAGSVAYIKMTKNGDNYFGEAKARILGGEGTGAAGTPTVQTVTGLSLLNEGRNYATPPTLIFEGGGGQNAQGAAEIDTLGKVTGISINDAGEFYQEPPYVLITGGGGIGARAEATVDQGAITGVNITNPGAGYVNPPSIIFTKLVNLKRKTRARQAFNSGVQYLTGLVKDVATTDSEIFVDSTDAFPGSGTIILNTETISYTSKSSGKFSGLTRGVNFNYDQRVILDDLQNINGVSQYKFNVGDRVLRRVENANNKVAKVYDWNPNTRELLVTFEVDELAFIDAGIPSTEDAIVQFDAGVASSSGQGVTPHTVISSEGNSITLLTDPISILADSAFEDDDEQDGAGDGIPDLINTGTDFENQIGLDGGIYNSLYGIEETLGGENTTLFQVGDSVKDGSIPSIFAGITTAGTLGSGLEHESIIDLVLDTDDGNGQSFTPDEFVTGDVSGVRGTVVSWNPSTGVLQVKDVLPYNTGNVNIGISGYLYEFSKDSTVVDVFIQNAGTNYTAVPTVTFENTGDIQATGTAVLTTAGDQVASITITNGGYGIPQTVDGTYNLHPTITFTNDASDTTGSGAVGYAIMGGEKITANGGAQYRIKDIRYNAIVRTQ